MRIHRSIVLSLAATVASASLVTGSVAAAATLLPEVIPDEIPHGTIDTGLGTIRWAHLTGDGETLPDPLTPAVGTSGLVWFEGGGPRQGPCDPPAGGDGCDVDVPPRLWTSDDALSERTQHELPIDADAASLTLVGDTYWLTTADPASLWRSDDLTRWDAVDVGALVSPGPEALEWGIEIGTPVTSGPATIVPVLYRAQDLGRLVGLPGQAVHLEEAGEARYEVSAHRLKSRGGDRVVGWVRFEETPTGLIVTDDEGVTIAEIEGVGMDRIDEWVESGTISEHELAVVDGSTLTTVDPPGRADPHEGATLFPVDDGFVAFEVDSRDRVRTWRSADGRSWVQGDLLLDDKGRPWRAEWVGAYSGWGTHELTVLPAGASNDPSPYWVSRDMETWTRQRPHHGGDGLFFEGEHGLIRIADDYTWSVSRDGERWEEVKALGASIPTSLYLDAGGYGGSVIDDTLFFNVTSYSDWLRRDLWIIELAPRPGS